MWTKNIYMDEREQWHWQGVKKHGRAYTLSVASEFNSETTNEGAAGYSFPVFTRLHESSIARQKKMKNLFFHFVLRSLNR